MSSSEVQGAKALLSFFSALDDPRVARTRKHPLLTVVVIATLGVICGAEGWEELHVFGTKKLTFLATFLDMRNGVPCADTFRRVFEALRPRVFAACFERFVQALAASSSARQGHQHIAIDGKTLRHSFDTATGQTALHLVHAWSVDHRLLLGQVATAEKSNEITAIPALLAMLDLRNTLVTTDAMGCQKAIVDDIVKGGGDYLLALKDNHPTLCAEVDALFEEDSARKQRLASSACERTTGHGRIETRYVRALPAPTTLSGYKEWKGLTSLVCVSSVRLLGDS